jgi:hypothetical protein
MWATAGWDSFYKLSQPGPGGPPAARPAAPTLPSPSPFERAAVAVTRGGRRVVVYCPKPLAGYWEAGDYRAGRGRTAFQVGASVTAYATGRVPPLARGHSVKAPR